jgi:hypothetical protein
MIRYVYLTKPPSNTYTPTGERNMSRKPSKDEALEALDFIINVLKEHEKDLDRLISQLGDTLEQYSDTSQLTGKITNVEDRLAHLQTQITELIQFISTPQTKPALPTPPQGPPVIVRCKNWNDFKNLATNAETISYLPKEPEKAFQAQALKNSRVLTYSGELPQNTTLLKTWLSKTLNTPEQNIFEGALAIG